PTPAMGFSILEFGFRIGSRPGSAGKCGLFDVEIRKSGTEPRTNQPTEANLFHRLTGPPSFEIGIGSMGFGFPGTCCLDPVTLRPPASLHSLRGSSGTPVASRVHASGGRSR